MRQPENHLERGFKLQLDTKAVSVASDARCVVADDGKEYPYDVFWSRRGDEPENSLYPEPT